MPEQYTGRTVNINSALQSHLDANGRLELVIQRNGKSVLDLLPSAAMIESLKVELEGK